MSERGEAPFATSPSPTVDGLTDRYRVIAEKGSSPFGTVYLAEDTANGRLVAIRLLPREVTDVPTVAEAIHDRGWAVIEASTAHSSLAAVLGYGSTCDGRVFAVMERVTGRPLTEILAHRRHADVTRLVQLAIDVGGAVDTLHRLGLVHGALRSRNCLVADDGSVKLLDVELIALRDVPALQHTFADRLPQTDIYAFADLFHEMLLSTVGSRRYASRATSVDSPVATALVRQPRRAVPAAVHAELAKALRERPEHEAFMQAVLDHLGSDGSARRDRRKRIAVLAAGFIVVLAASLPVLRGFVTSGPPAHAAKPGPPGPAPVMTPKLTEPDPEPVPEDSTRPAVSVVEEPPATASASRTDAAPVAAPASPRMPRLETERRPAPRTPSALTRRSTQSSPADSADHDAGAVIDWLLNQRGER